MPGLSKEILNMAGQQTPETSNGSTQESFSRIRIPSIRALFERTPQPWILLASLITSLVTALLLFEYSNTKLIHFKDRVIGICALSGIDPDLRTLIFIKIVFTFILVFLASYGILSLIDRHLQKAGISFRITVEKTVISLFMSVALVNLMLYIISLNAAFKRTFAFLMFTVCLVSGITAARLFLEKIAGRRWYRQSNYAVFAASIIIPYQLLLGWAALFEKKLAMGLNYSLYYVSGWALMSLAGFLLQSHIESRPKKNRDRLTRAFLYSGVPLILLPAVMPLANEMQYTLVKHISIRPQNLAFAGVASTFMLSGALFIYFLKTKQQDIATRKIISNIYFPAIIAVDIILVTYRHYLEIEQFDLFHMSEAILGLQQMVHFGRIPFIDQHFNHGLFDLFPQLFYYLINRTTTFDMLSWGNGYMMNWVSNTVAYLLFYLLFKKLTTPLFALLVILCIPFRQIFDPYYTPLIIPPLAFFYAMKRPTMYRFSLFWVSLCFIVLWRVDFGLAATGGALLVIGGIYMTRKEVPIKRNPIVSFFVVSLSAFTLFAGTALLNGKSPFDLILRNYVPYYFLTGSQSYAQIVREYDFTAILQYFFLPAVSIIYIVFYCVRVFLLKKPLDHTRSLLAWFSLMSLIMSTRSLQRHSLYEDRFQVYFFVFLLIFLPLYLYRMKKSGTMALFLMISLFSYFLAEPYFNGFIYKISVKDGSPVVSLDRRIFSYHVWREGDERVVISDPGYYKILNITDFLNRHLKSGQTFFDFSNSPYLYCATNRRHPSFIYTGAIQTGDSVQIPTVKELEADMKNNTLPLVVFRGNSYWDFIDSVPSEIRSYRIAEFIYRNYFPLVKVDNFEIWGANTLDHGEIRKDVTRNKTIPTEKSPVLQWINKDSYRQEFHLRSLPFIWANYDETDPIHHSNPLFIVHEDLPFEIEKGRSHIIHINETIDKSKGNYLHLSLRVNTTANMKISYGETSENVIDFNLKNTGKTEEYLVRISSQWAWVSQRISSISLTATAPVMIEMVRILEGD